MINKVCISFFMLLLVMGCANQQKEAENASEEATISEAEAKVEVEEVSLTVTGMTWGNCTSKVQDALAKVTGVTEVVSVSHDENKAVVKVEKGQVKTEDLVAAVEGIEEVDGAPRFPAKATE